jgi:Transcription initiation factor TFIID component TAF4 family
VNKVPTSISDGGKAPTEGLKMTNDVVKALRELASAERDFEEARLRKRQARATGGDVSSRQSSVVPGTPGSVAPEAPEKAPTKKEQTKKAQAKVNEAANHVAANQTTSQFLGGGGSMFGKKKKYAWMTGGAGGGGGSGTSTPSRLMAQGGGHSTPATPAVPAKLTSDGVRRVGAWREDHDKGKGIQLRDWIAVLEDDGREKRALQLAYMNLDDSGPK